jgi:hypothetical protein
VPTRETLEGLRRVGFRLNTGIEGTGFILLVWQKASGYYFGAFFSRTALLIGHRTRLPDVNHRRWREPIDN